MPAKTLVNCLLYRYPDGCLRPERAFPKQEPSGYVDADGNTVLAPEDTPGQVVNVFGTLAPKPVSPSDPWQQKMARLLLKPMKAVELDPRKIQGEWLPPLPESPAPPISWPQPINLNNTKYDDFVDKMTDRIMAGMGIPPDIFNGTAKPAPAQPAYPPALCKLALELYAGNGTLFLEIVATETGLTDRTEILITAGHVAGDIAACLKSGKAPGHNAVLVLTALANRATPADPAEREVPRAAVRRKRVMHYKRKNDKSA